MTETLLGISQLAVAIAGFAAIVEAIGSRDAAHWNHNVFNGMVIHALVALGFALSGIAAVELGFRPASVWRVLCGTIGAQLALQAAAVIAFFRQPGDSRTPIWAMPPAGLALVAVSLGWIDLPASGGFVVGLCLHLLQAAVLFLMLVHQRAARD